MKKGMKMSGKQKVAKKKAMVGKIADKAMFNYQGKMK